MGLTLEFYSGDSRRILQAVAEVSFDYLGQLRQDGLYADMSLHIEPRDLGFLTITACEMLSLQSTTLREHLRLDLKHVDEPDRGAYLVGEEWVSLIAQINQSAGRQLTEGWFDRMDEQYPNEEIAISDAAVHSVDQLVHLCKFANDNQSDVVHVWFL